MVQVTVSGLNETLSGLLRAFRAVSGGKLPENTRIALQTSLELMAEEWRMYLTKKKGFPESDKIKNPMARSASAIRTKIDGDGQGGTVSAGGSWSDWMEKGAPAFDMKTTHPYGRKSRVGRDGTPYLIIPIRHGTPGSVSNPMPRDFYAAIRKTIKDGGFKASQVTSAQHHTEPNFKGQDIMRAGYAWGDRITGVSDQFKNLEGMVRFAKKSSGGGHLNSSYMTFRIISAKSPDGMWINPAKPKITPYVIAATQDTVAQIMEAGLRQDLGL